MFIKSHQIYCIISFKSSDKRSLNNYLNKIKTILMTNKHYTYNFICKPIKNKRFYILRSPHVYKKSLETYEEQIFSKSLIIKFTYSPNLYSHFLVLIKFIKTNIPLNINMTLQLPNNV